MIAFSGESRLSVLQMAYVPPEEEGSLQKEANMSADVTKTATKAKNLVFPQVGDMVRYYDLDGGDIKGQELVGRISFLVATSGSPSGYLLELTPMEDLGDGFYGEYSSTKKFLSQSVERDAGAVSPLRASFVRSEQAYKVPVTKEGILSVRQENYDLREWEGPKAIPVDTKVLEADNLNYQTIKFNLFKNAAIAGLLGTIGVNVVQGTQDAGIYLTGVLASLAYLFLLSVKTDTLGQSGNNLGSRISSLRFFMPLFVLIAVAFFNMSQGDANPMAGSTSVFDTVTPEQFASAALGFLTYRVPLFISQLKEALRGDTPDEDSNNSLLPGSAGIALQLAQGASSSDGQDGLLSDEGALIPVLLVSGPQATGRSELVKQLVEVDDRMVLPSRIDRTVDGVTFERLQTKGQLLQIDPAERFGLTREAILEAGPRATQAAVDAAMEANGGDLSGVAVTPKAVVVDADVALAKKLQSSLSGARLVGVWVGLDSVAAFESRILQSIEDGDIPVSEEESEESVLRARIKEIVNEIDFGLSSGIFEFTILNTDTEKGLRELKEAASYCFK